MPGAGAVSAFWVLLWKQLMHVRIATSSVSSVIDCGWTSLNGLSSLLWRKPDHLLSRKSQDIFKTFLLRQRWQKESVRVPLKMDKTINFVSCNGKLRIAMRKYKLGDMSESAQEARRFCTVAGYPVLVRPSYVLSGAAMRVVTNDDERFPQRVVCPREL